MTRNPDATCANCPYWQRDCDKVYISGDRHPSRFGQCRRQGAPSKAAWVQTAEIDWCPDHPSFWLREPKSHDAMQFYPKELQPKETT